MKSKSELMEAIKVNYDESKKSSQAIQDYLNSDHTSDVAKLSDLSQINQEALQKYLDAVKERSANL
jgi:hypothetical protein